MTERACQAVGIDLGTTYSSLAYLDKRGVVQVVNDAAGQAVMPSVVYFDDHAVLVGDVALQQSKIDVSRSVQFIKAHMGEPWKREFNGHAHTPESLSAIIISHLKREAESQIGPIPSAVITVPAFFVERRRRATEQAGVIAGLDVLGTLNEPMAATLAYGLYRGKNDSAGKQMEDQAVVVFDLGGGTFDVTIVRISPTEIWEIATEGNRRLGGRDWDDYLLNLIADDFKRAHGVDLRQEDPQAEHDLRIECELAKRRLSSMKRTPVVFHACGKRHTTSVTREQFEAATAHLVQGTRLTVELALSDAGLSWDKISRVLLVGGSTQMPAIRRMLQEASGSPPDSDINPVTAVAKGAAIYAHILESGQQGPEIFQEAAEEERPDTPFDEKPAVLSAAAPGISLEGGAGETAEAQPPGEKPSETEPPPVENPIGLTVDSVKFVTAHGVGIRVREGERWKNEVLIKANTRVPKDASKRCHPTKKPEAGSYIRVEITQGDTADPDLAEVLGVGRIEGFSGDEPAQQPVDVIMQFDRLGRLSVSAKYGDRDTQLIFAMEIPNGLTPDEVENHHEHLKEMGVLSVFQPDDNNADDVGNVEGDAEGTDPEYDSYRANDD